MRLRRWIVLAAVSLVPLWVAIEPAQACPPDPAIVLNPDKVLIGDTVTFFGTGFEPDTPVTVTLRGGGELGRPMASDRGWVEFTLLSDVIGAGEWMVHASGAAGCATSAPLEIVATAAEFCAEDQPVTADPAIVDFGRLVRITGTNFIPGTAVTVRTTHLGTGETSEIEISAVGDGRAEILRSVERETGQSGVYLIEMEGFGGCSGSTEYRINCPYLTGGTVAPDPVVVGETSSLRLGGFTPTARVSIVVMSDDLPGVQAGPFFATADGDGALEETLPLSTGLSPGDYEVWAEDSFACLAMLPLAIEAPEPATTTTTSTSSSTTTTTSTTSTSTTTLAPVSTTATTSSSSPGDGPVSTTTVAESQNAASTTVAAVGAATEGTGPGVLGISLIALFFAGLAGVIALAIWRGRGARTRTPPPPPRR